MGDEADYLNSWAYCLDDDTHVTKDDFLEDNFTIIYKKAMFAREYSKDPTGQRIVPGDIIAPVEGSHHWVRICCAGFDIKIIRNENGRLVRWNKQSQPTKIKPTKPTVVKNCNKGIKQ